MKWLKSGGIIFSVLLYINKLSSTKVILIDIPTSGIRICLLLYIFTNTWSQHLSLWFFKGIYFWLMKAMLQSPTPANVLHAPDLFNITRYLNISKANPFARNAFTAFEWQSLIQVPIKMSLLLSTFSDSPRSFIGPSHPHGCWYRSHWLRLRCSIRVTFCGCLHPWTLRLSRAGMIGRQLSSWASPEYLVCAWPVLGYIELPWQ